MLQSQVMNMAVNDLQPQTHGTKRPAPQRCRSDSIASIAVRPLKRARSVSSQQQQQGPSRPQSTGPEGSQYQYQTILPQHSSQQHIQSQPPQQLQPQQHVQGAHQSNHIPQHSRQNGSMNRHGLDVAVFGVDASFNQDAVLRSALQDVLHHPRNNSVSQFSAGTSISPTVEEMNHFNDSQGIDIDFDDSSLMQKNGTKSKSKKHSAMEDNEIELRRLAAENMDVPMDILANKVREDENGPQAEKTRQSFGMAWLLRSCERQPETGNPPAVPRSRVYARYVGVCANERIKPLNPASFGKLVRLMYPDIKTRRLGIRGQSKYHYVGIKIIGEEAESPKPSHTFLPAETIPGPSSNPMNQIPLKSQNNHLTNEWSMPNDTNAIFAMLPEGFGLPPKPIDEPKLAPEDFLQTILYFPHPDENLDEVGELVLPDIHIYAESNTDRDNAASLTAIYRSHCVSLLEAVRYLQIKKLFHLFTSFQGTLTAPVQKLFSEPSLARWIEDADWAMYKEMIRMLCPHSLSVVPLAVLQALKTISTSLPGVIRDAFSGQVEHVVEARLMPATIFASLLDRMLRVNEAAHASAKILSHTPDREVMRSDWIDFVKAKQTVTRELPCRAPEVVDILNVEIVKILSPERSDEQELDFESGLTPEPSGADSSTETILDNWVQFLTTLPSRFPNASPRTIMHSVGAVATACLRDITMAGGEGFGGWWVIRCWIDEFMGWQAERSGFLRYSPKRERPREAYSVEAHDDITFDLMAPLQPGTADGQAMMNHHNNMNKHVQQEDSTHDDSGLSMREDLLDDMLGGPEKLDNATLDMAFQDHE